MSGHHPKSIEGGCRFHCSICRLENRVQASAKCPVISGARVQKHLVACSAPDVVCICILYRSRRIDAFIYFDIENSKHDRGLFESETHLNYSVRLSHPIWKMLRQSYGLPLWVQRPQKKHKPLCRRDFSKEDDSEDNDYSGRDEMDQSDDKDECDIGDTMGRRTVMMEMTTSVGMLIKIFI